MLMLIINGLFRVVEFIANFIMSAFPVSPFQWDITVPSWARWMGVFIPWSEMAVFLTAYVNAVLFYYVVRTLARWVKLVGS